MRVLLVTDFYPPYAGGVEHHVRALAHGLVDRGHEVAVATLEGPITDGHGDDGAVSVRRLRGVMHRIDRLVADSERPWAPPLPDPELAQGLRSVIGDFRPDVIHGHDWLARSVLPVARGIPVVNSLHYYSRSCAKKNLLRDGSACPGPSLRRCVPCAGAHYGWVKGLPILAGTRLGAAWERRSSAATISVSEACAVGNDGDRHEAVVIANSRIEGEIADDVPDLPDDDFILYVGDLRPEKGVRFLLEAYGQLEAPPPLVIIGGMGDVDVSALGGDVRLLGERPHDQVLAAFSRCLFSVVPSIWSEPFGLVVLEAMAAGRPVVASAVGGIADIITDGHDGLLVEPESPPALAAALRRLLGDGSERHQLGENARVTAAGYGPAAMVAHIETVYANVVR